MNLKAIKKLIGITFIGMLICEPVVANYANYDTTQNVFLKNDLLPQAHLWAEMYDNAADIEASLNSGDGRYRLMYKRKGGSSQQTLVIRNSDEKVMGIWSAPNHATYLEGEIFAFNLARLLGHSEWATPGTRMYLTGPGREMAYRAFNPASTPRARRCNQAHMNSYYRANQYYMPGAFFAFIDGVKPDDLPELVYTVRTIGLTPDHWVTNFITGRDTPSDSLVYYKRNTRGARLVKDKPEGDYRVSTEQDVARQLSFLTIVDALNSQRDRFGIYGSNMEVMISTQSRGGFSISLIDNGGISTSHNTSSLKTFLGQYNAPKRQSNGQLGKAIPPVVRFEKKVFDRVLAVHNFLASDGASPLIIDGITYNTEAELKEAMGIESIAGSSGTRPASVCGGRGNHFYLFNLDRQYEIRWSNFKKALAAVANHMKAIHNRDGERTFIPMSEAEDSSLEFNNAFSHYLN